MIKAISRDVFFTSTIDPFILLVVSNFQREVLLREQDFFSHPQLNIGHRGSYIEFCVLFEYLHPVVKS